MCFGVAKKKTLVLLACVRGTAGGGHMANCLGAHDREQPSLGPSLTMSNACTYRKVYLLEPSLGPSLTALL